MSSLSISASVAAGSLRQLLTNTAASTPDTRRPPTNANPPSPAGTGGTTTAPVSPFSTGNANQLQPTAPTTNTNAPVTPANPNPANQAAQQITTSNAANSKAIQAGSNRIGSFLDINA